MTGRRKNGVAENLIYHDFLIFSQTKMSFFVKKKRGGGGLEGRKSTEKKTCNKRISFRQFIFLVDVKKAKTETSGVLSHFFLFFFFFFFCRFKNVYEKVSNRRSALERIRAGRCRQIRDTLVKRRKRRGATKWSGVGRLHGEGG